VSHGYAKRQWVRRRCEHARHEVPDGLTATDKSASLSDHMIEWLFVTGRTTHVLLMAELQNPTVRRRYIAVQELLAGYGQLAFYEMN